MRVTLLGLSLVSLLTPGLVRAQDVADDWSLTRARPRDVGALPSNAGTPRQLATPAMVRERLYRALLASPSDDYVLEQLVALSRAEPDAIESLLERLRSERAQRPHDDRPYQALARMLFALQRPEPALAELEEAVLQVKDVASTRSLQARLLRELGRYTEAAQQMRALARDPRRAASERARWLRDAARDELAAGAAESALAALAEAKTLGGAGTAAELRPLWQQALRQAGRSLELGELLERERAWLAAAEVWETYGDLARALRAYAARLAQAADDLAARAARARLLAQTGRFDEAKRELAELVRRAPDQPSYLVQWAELERDSEGQAAALALLSKSSAQRPGASALHRALYELYVRWNEAALAEHELQLLGRLSAGDPESRLLLADRALARGDRTAALRLLGAQPGAAGDPHATELRLARLLGERDLLPEAIEHARRAAAGRADQTESRRVLASLLERAGQTVEAERAWRDVARASSADGAVQREVREHLVSLWRRSGSDRLHATELAAQLRAGPFALDDALLLLALYARDPQQRAQHAAVLEQLLAHAPDDPEALTALARTQREQGDVRGALRTSARLLELAGPGAQAHALAALELAESYPNEDEVPALVSRALAVAPRDGRLERLAGTVFLKRQQLDLARAAFERALVLEPRDFSAQYALAEDAIRRADQARAEALLKSVIDGGTDDALVVEASQQLLQLAGDRGVDFLLRSSSLSDLDPTRRRVLMAYYERSVLPLSAAPSSDDAAERLRSAVQRAGGLLLRALARGDAHERALALALLTACPLANALLPLLTLAERADASAHDRAAALVALVAVPRTADTRVAARLRALYARASRPLRPFVVWALAESDPEGAADALRAALTDRDPDVRALASLAAGRGRQLALVPALRALVAEPLPSVRAAATWALAHLAPSQPPLALTPAELTDTASAMLLLTVPDATLLRRAHALFADASALRVLAAQLLTHDLAPVAQLPTPAWPFSLAGYLERVARAQVALRASHRLSGEAWAALGALASERLMQAPLASGALAALRPFEGGLLPEALLASAACADAESARALARRLRPVLAALAAHADPDIRILARELSLQSGGLERPELSLRSTAGRERRALLESLVHASVVPSAALRSALQEVLASAPDWPTRMWAVRALGGTAAVLAREPVALVRAAAAFETPARSRSTVCPPSSPVTN